MLEDSNGQPVNGQAPTLTIASEDVIAAIGAMDDACAMEFAQGVAARSVALPEQPGTSSETTVEDEDDDNEVDPVAVIARAEVENRINCSGIGVPDGSWLEAENALCVKTGAVLGNAYLIEDWSDTQQAQILNAPVRGVTAAWLQDGPRDLDWHCENDPQGYATYALSLLCALYRKQYHLTSSADGPQSATSLWTLARARLWIDCTTDDRLEALNQTLLRCLSLGDIVLRQIPRQFRIAKLPCDAAFPDSMARAAQAGDLQPILAKCYGAALAACESAALEIKKGKRTQAAIPHTAAEAAQKGPSNVRGQRQSRRAIQQAMEFQALFAEFGLSIGSFVDKPSAPEVSAPSFPKFLKASGPIVQAVPPELPADNGAEGIDDFNSLFAAFSKIDLSDSEIAEGQSEDVEEAFADVLDDFAGYDEPRPRERGPDFDDTVEMRVLRRPLTGSSQPSSQSVNVPTPSKAATVLTPPSASVARSTPTSTAQGGKPAFMRFLHKKD